MKIQSSKGSALWIVLLVILAAVSLIAIVMMNTSTVAKNTDKSRQYQAAQTVAAGAVEYGYAVWLKKISAKHDLLTTGSDLAIAYYPSFTGTNAPAGTDGFIPTTDGTLQIQALDMYGVAISSSNTQPALVISPVPNYPGWWGRTYTYAATARYRVDVPNYDPKNPPPSAGARRLFYYTEVPLFQCMYFFQDDLEIYNPASMIVSGLIATNHNLYLSTKTASSNFKINGQATYASPYIFSSSEPPGAVGTTSNTSGSDYPPLWNNGGQSAQLHQVPPMSPMGSALDQVFSNPTYSSNPNVIDGYHELVEVPNPSYTDPIETDPNNPRRIYNIAAKKGGVVIHVTGTSIVAATSSSTTAVNASSIAITTLDTTTGLPVSVPNKTVLIAAGTGSTLPTTAGATDYNNAVYAFSQALSKQAYNATTKFYDDRENEYMNVVNVDVGLLNTAIGNSLGSSSVYNNVVYIYDDSTSPAPNVVRLKNGAIIASSDGLTVGSLNPVYVQGDYNTGSTASNHSDVPSDVGNSNNDQTNYKTGYTTKPAAIIADAVTLLSNAWSDANSASALTSRTASNTTYNMALLGGYIGSNTTNKTYSGGAINYPRFLEGWSGIYCTYFGSMVELFPSLSSTCVFIPPGQSNAYYSAPNRRFNFDTTYSSKSPPGSTNAIVLSRGLWMKW